MHTQGVRMALNAIQRHIESMDLWTIASEHRLYSVHNHCYQIGDIANKVTHSKRLAHKPHRFNHNYKNSNLFIFFEPRRLLPVGGVYRHSRAMCRSEGITL